MMSVKQNTMFSILDSLKQVLFALMTSLHAIVDILGSFKRYCSNLEQFSVNRRVLSKGSAEVVLVYSK